MYFVPPPPALDAEPLPPSRPPRTSTRRRSAPPDPNALAWNRPIHSMNRILFEPECSYIVASALLLGETLLCTAIITRVPYTEIDFKTYLEQARVFLSGERDYSLFKGESGPAVYPAGHIYVFSLLDYLTSSGTNLVPAQVAFAGVYLATLAFVFAIYSRSDKIPPYALVFLTFSKRVHSLYLLRMFNDCVAMLFLYAALFVYSRQGTRGETKNAIEKRWIVGTLLFSFALSIKMSILLFLPALLYLTFVYLSPVSCLLHVVLLSTSQLVLASPFLSTLDHAKAYFVQSFDFGRQFLWEWTVNWRWIGVEVFEDEAWGKILLVGHAVGLIILALRWAEEEGGVETVLKRAWKNPSESPAKGQLTATRVTTVFFLSNLVGVVCARSVHYQFYTWFYHSLVWVLWDSWSGIEIEVIQKLVLTSLIEYGFHSYPSTVNSSIGLVLSLVVMVVVAYYGRPAGDQGEPVERGARGVGRREEKRKVQ
ncbi:hypothetical protein JCM10212_003014 [Sporobolomyces blumeae]